MNHWRRRRTRIFSIFDWRWWLMLMDFQGKICHQSISLSFSITFSLSFSLSQTHTHTHTHTVSTTLSSLHICTLVLFSFSLSLSLSLFFSLSFYECVVASDVGVWCDDGLCEWRKRNLLDTKILVSLTFTIHEKKNVKC